MNSLGARFARAVSAAGGDPSASGAVFAGLASRYGEPQRHYHTLAHLEACLGFFDWFVALAESPDRVELALFYHDAVYDPARADNERRSAALARGDLAGLGVPHAVLATVASYVEATASHAAAAGDAALVNDADLAILGASRVRYDVFEARVRREYAHVPEAAYAVGRRAVLEGFLRRPEIYGTPMIREELEGRARDNLARRVRELAATARP